jgi:hypothetical protein
MSSSAASTSASSRADSISNSAAASIAQLKMNHSIDQFDVWLTRVTLFIQSEKPELEPLLDPDVASTHAYSPEAQQLAALLIRFVQDDFFTRFRRQITVDRPTKINGAKFFYLIWDYFRSAAPMEELPEEMFTRGMRSCFRDKFRSVPEFVRAAQGILQSVQSAASSSLPVLERMMVLHVLTQLGINNFCPWAPTMLAEYRKAYRAHSSLDSVPKGFTLANVVETVIGHITVAPGARDIHRGRYTDRPQCSYCGRFGHVEASCNTKKGVFPGKGAATGPTARVHEVNAGFYGETDEFGNPILNFNC